MSPSKHTPQLDTPLRTFFFSFGAHPGTCFARRREGLVSSFLLSSLPSVIGDLLVRISTSATRKIPQGQIWRGGRLGTTVVSCFVKHSWIRSYASADAAQVLRQNDASSVFRSKSGGTNFYRFLLLRQLHEQLGDDFDESQQAISRYLTSSVSYGLPT